MSDQVKFVGTGWENSYGIAISVKLSELQSLPVDNYGNVKLYVGRRKEKDSKSGATHYVKENKPKPEGSVQTSIQPDQPSAIPVIMPPEGGDDLPF